MKWTPSAWDSDDGQWRITLSPSGSYLLSSMRQTGVVAFATFEAAAAAVADAAPNK